MKWQITCAVNTAKAMLPFQAELRLVKRRLRPPRLGCERDSVVSGGVDHITALRQAGLEMRGAHVLEIGSGWFPIIPLMMRAAGAERVYMADAHRLMDTTTLDAAIDFVIRRGPQIAERLDLPLADVQKLAAARGSGGSFNERLDRLGFVYLAPFDPDRMLRVDAIVSQTVFEHIPPPDLLELLAKSKEWLNPGGLMSHGIDNTDHRIIGDQSLGRFDFLKYSDRVWKLFCYNPQDYTNRLRHSDYARLFTETGYDVAYESRWVDRQNELALASAKLAPWLEGRSAEDLATGWSHFVTRPRPD